MDKVVQNPLHPEEQERLKHFQEEIEGQELTVLLERIQKQFDLSANQIAVAAGMDESALHKILKGENREFKAEHVDALLDYLEQQDKLKSFHELAVWKRALRVSAFLHFEIYKAVEPRLRKIEDPVKRIEALRAYLREQYPALAQTYDKSGGTFPVFLPLFDVVARELTKRFAEPQFPPTATRHQSEVNKKYLGGIEFMSVPAGKFLMGSHSGIEKPLHTVDIPYDYWMMRFPVTVKQCKDFLEATDQWQDLEHLEYYKDWRDQENHPVAFMETNDFCNWLNNLLKDEIPPGLVLRLPTEAEWEKAARGTDGREYPWGDEFDKNKCNTKEGNKGTTTPVGLYSPHGDSAYGCADMAGNVWEWTHSLLREYPYEANDGREDESSDDYARLIRAKEGRDRSANSRFLGKVLRGGCYYYEADGARCAFRISSYVGYFLIGFRLVAAPSISEVIIGSNKSVNLLESFSEIF